MSIKDRRLVECTTCYTLASYLNGVCRECGGTGVIEKKEQPAPGPSTKDKRDPKSALD